MQSLTQTIKTGPKPPEIEAGPKPVTTETAEQALDSKTGAQPVESETVVQESEESVVPMENEKCLKSMTHKPGLPENKLGTHSLQSETVMATDESEMGAQTLEGETITQTLGRVTATQAVENETAVQPIGDLSLNTRGMEEEMDTNAKPSATTEVVPGTKQNPDSVSIVQGMRQVDKEVPDGRKYIPRKKGMLDPLKMDMSKPVVMPLTSSQLSLQCIECHIIFSDHKSKERHLKLSHPAEYEQCILRNALFACYVCDRHFTNSTELMVHQKAHIERKPFKCPICGQAFNKSSELTVHKKIHFGRDGYACSDCGKPCKTLTLLKYHRRTHTGERPYVCKECGKRFSMSKALQKHMVSHFPEGVEEDGGNALGTAKTQLKKPNSTPTIKYPCSVCKATFKSTKTRLHHMKNKHNLLPAATSNALPAGQQVRQGAPIITPISICQPTLLHVEPIGPLQQVDANIDTEQIRKLIESLGNVQKVNQVVILGQVPPNAPPLDLQQIQALGEPINLNLAPPQIELLELKQTEQSQTMEVEHAKNQCDLMEQTIILEPITPDGQLENPSFPELVSHIAPPENIGLTLVEPEQIERPEGKMIHQLLQQTETIAIQSIPLDQTVCQSEVADLEQNPEQTIILELTSALIPTVELEQAESVPQMEMPSSSLVPTTELEKTSDETVIEQQENSLSVPPLMPTVQLELTPLQTDQQDLPTCSFISKDTFAQTSGESQTNPEREADSQIQTVRLDQVHPVLETVSVEETHEETVSVEETHEETVSVEETPEETVSVEETREETVSVEETHEKIEQEPSENALVDSRECQEKPCTSEDTTTQEQIPAQLETKKIQQVSHSTLNVMSAQELVKVRKRKPARTFIFEGNMEQLAGTIQKEDIHFGEKPVKRQRTRKSHLVVKFGPKNKEKKNKKQKKQPQQNQWSQEELSGDATSVTTLSEKKMPSKKTGRKAKKDKKEAHLVSQTEMKSTLHDSHVKQSKQDLRKNKVKKQKDVVSVDVEQISKQEIVTSPVPKRKKPQKMMQKCQPKKTKDGRLTSKGRKRKLTKEQNKVTETTLASVNIPVQQITQDSLLLLKGHKQPQLKVYKLDPSKAPGQTQESSCQDSPKTCQSKDATLKQRKDMSEPPNMLTAGSKKKGGRPKKNQRALSLLSSVLVSRPQPEALPTRPKTTRKRKASLKVETEGVITSTHSKRALECKDCGERFSGVSSLQEHKATAHIVESPGLTYTNGNIFEGVSRLDLCHPPKMTTEVIGVMNPATDWDTEAEMGEMALDEREGRVSFPALNPSPSLPVAAADVDDTGLEEKNENTVMGDITAFIGTAKKPSEQPCHTPPEVLSPCCSSSDQMKSLGSNSESSCFTSVTPFNSSPQTRDSEAGGPAASDEAKPTYQVSGEDIPRSPLLHSSESEVQGTTDEDIKEGLLLEVDLVTVGEENERDNATLASESGSQNEVVGPCSPESNSTNTLIPTAQIDSEKTEIIQTASHSTQPQEFKDEEEEILVQRKEEGVRGAGRRRGTRGRRGGRGGRGRLKRGVICDREAEKESDECQVIFQKYLLTADSDINSEDKTSTVPNAQSTSREQLEISSGFEPNKGMPPATSVPSSLEESPEEQPVFEMESEAELRREGVEELDRESGQSSGDILERFLASRQTEAGDEDQSQMPIRIGQRQGSDGIAENEVIFREVEGGQEIKVEENISDPPPVAQTSESRQRMDTQPQHQRGVRIVLVKQESSLILNDPQATLGSRHIRWNVERMDIETPPVTEVGAGTRASSVAPDFNSKHCIFYPVKEEEREVLLGATHRDNNVLTLGESSDARLGQKTECRPASSCLYEESPDAEDYQEIRVRELQLGTEINDFENTGQNIEQQDTPELRDFLLQSSDEEDSDVYEFSDPQPDSEAQAMANFYRNQNSSPPEPNEISQNLPTSEEPHSHSLREGSGSREPIYYFCKYFDWDTWAEIAQCTNKLSNIPNPVTPKEIAEYVGIHIAMGTLKFPSLKLYWQDLTKVPLIAEAMPLSRFLQLSRKLKLAFPDKEPITKCREERHERDIQNVQPVTATSSAPSSCNMSSYGQIPLLGNGQSHGENTNDCLNIQTDPLWRVQPLLRRFQAGCLLLRQEGNYGVDQYPLPLTTVKVNNNNRSLHCTTLIGFGGLILHFDLKLDRSDKEAAVEKIVPRDSMVFLCKQELSTPAMLERLLIAGVHGVGRVGGATGQIGDEFVSSDGRLMLRRSHCGFILSTVENGQRNMASLINNFEKAQTSARLNRDLRNLYRIPLTALVPSCWPQAVLWCLTDLALVNSWLLYRQDHRTESELLTLMAFRLEVAKTLILSSGSDTQDSIAPQPNTQKAHASSVIPNPDLLQESPLPEASLRYDGSGHWPEQLEAGEGGRCRFGGCERTSRVLCLKCCVFLCISRNHNCFLNFHNQGRL